jgi:hypothetical protein
MGVRKRRWSWWQVVEVETWLCGTKRGDDPGGQKEYDGWRNKWRYDSVQ